MFGKIVYPRGVEGDGAGTEPLTLGSAEEMSQYAHAMNSYDDGTTSLAWEMPIVVQGMSWPLKYEIIGDTPVGLSIGETLTPSGDTQIIGSTYGVLSWSAPIAGTYAFGVRVTDQDGNIREMWWQHVAGSANHRFVDSVSGNDSTGTGLIGAPLQTFNHGVWQDDTAGTDATWQNKIVHYLAGTYEIDNGVNDSDITYSSIKPKTHIPYPGATVTWNINCNAGVEDDFFIGEVITDGFKTGATQPHLFAAANATTKRIQAFKTTVKNLYFATVNLNNPSFMYAASVNDGINSNQYIGVTRCKLDTTSNCALSMMFDVDYFVGEYCDADGVNFSADHTGCHIHHAKEDCSNVTIRANHGINMTLGEGGALAISNQGQATYDKSFNQEICWNVITGSDREIVQWNAGVSNGNETNMHDYRNTFRSSTYQYGWWAASTEKVQMNNDILYGTGGRTDGVSNLGLVVAADDVDTSGLLVDGGTYSGGARTMLLGTHGHEVA
jgi:hypothetical protein